MPLSLTSHRLAWLTLACGLPLAAFSCRSSRQRTAAPPAIPVEVPPELTGNTAAESFSPIVRLQAASAIRWQPWSKETFERAEKANRLVFAVIVNPQQCDYQTVLSAMEANPALVRAVNDSYVPVLIDGGVFREMSLLAPVFCTDTKQPFRLPLFVWFTHAGDMVTTISINPASDTMAKGFEQAHETLGSMWPSSRDYILRNSATQQAQRTTLLAKNAAPPPNATEAAADSLTAIRTLSALYDPLSRSFDNIGGVFPAVSLELFASASLTPQLGEGLRLRAMDTANGLSHDLSTSAMIDPLDGGVFVARRGATWELPIFSRDCATQARAAISLFQASRTPGNPLLLDQARAALQFAERNYGTPNGLFTIGLDTPTPTEKWLWKLEELETVLPTGQARLWSHLSDWRAMGNIPIENDPKRAFLHLNRLALAVPLEKAAEKLGLSPEDARREFDTARQTLLTVRAKRFAAAKADPTPQAAASFRMTSAYAAAYAATGEPAFKQRAIQTLASARETFARGTDLRPYPDAVPPGEGRAFLYALAMQAALDVADITLDNAPAEWASQLAATVSERFVEGSSLLETPKDQNLTHLPVADRTMLFEESTAGLLSACEARLVRRGLKFPQALDDTAASLPASALRTPVQHADLLLAALFRHHGATVAVGSEAAPELKDAVAALPFRVYARATATPENPAPANAARIRFADGAEATATTPRELLSAIQAGGPKP